MHQTNKTCSEREHSILLCVTRTLYVYVQVCHSVGRCVKDGSRSLSSLEWKLMDSISGISYYPNKCQTLSNTSQMTFFSFRKTAYWCICIVRAAQSNCCGAFDFLSPEQCPPQQPELNALTTRFRESCIEQHEYASWVKKTEEIKERLVELWQCTDTAFEWKNAIFVFPRKDLHIIWGGIVKCFLIAYFMGNISAKNVKMRSRMSKL